MAGLGRAYGRMLEAVVIFLMVALTAVVVFAVISRKAGASLSWYDEVASIQLAWLTYYGAALAAYKRAHIGFPGLLEALEGDTLVSLPWVPVQVTQSVIPIGALLFLLGQAISLPEQLRRVREGRLLHEGETAEEGP